MKKVAIFVAVVSLSATSLFAQTSLSASTFWHPNPRHYEVKQALEVESLVPMFLFGGYHFAVGYRYKKFRVRASVINGCTYNAETVGLNNSSPAFKRFYHTSPGIFFGYNVWKNLELYTYLESHTFGIEQQSTGITKDIKSIDTGLGLSYQFFIGRVFYVQLGVHLYLRRNNGAVFGDVQYNISNADVSPVIRIGARLWKQYKRKSSANRMDNHFYPATQQTCSHDVSHGQTKIYRYCYGYYCPGGWHILRPERQT